MKRFIVAMLLAPLCGAFLLGQAHAQKTKAQLNTEVGTTFPDNTTGQITPSGVRSFQNDVINSIMPTAPVGDGNFACYDGTTGLLKDCELSPTGQYISNANISPGGADTVKGSLNGSTTSDIAVTACSLAYRFTQWVSGTGWQCGINPVLPSRATASSLDLSAHSVVRTLGYATAGDGGGATFVKVAPGTSFKDSYILTGTIAGGSGYTNGTYLGVPMGGGVGVGCRGKVTVAGGVVSAVDLTGGFCNGYAVGNVLTPLTSSIGGTGSGATFTVVTISTALGSFTDTVGNLWQYAVDIGNVPNVRQFGAKLDWNGVDASATNDLNSFKSALAFMSTTFSGSAAIVNGGTLFIPKGAAYLCASPAQFATVQVPDGVILKGAGVYGGTTLKQCTGASSAEHFISLCDPNSQFGQFGCKLEDLALVMTGTSAVGTAAVYSNSGQQFPLLNNVYIQPVGRQCVKYEIGKGGASNAIFENIDCERADSTTNVGFSGNSSGTQIVLRNWVFGCAPGNCGASAYAINMVAGNFIVENFHIEQHVDGINAATTASSNLSVIRSGTIVSGCVNGITLQATNPNNTVLVENIESSCSTATVLNGHGGGSNVTGHILAQRVFNP